MFDKEKLESFFNADNIRNKSETKINKRSKNIRRAKLLLPSIAAALIGLLIAFPSLQQSNRDFSIDITRPKKGELEKLHMENTIFYITDKDNKVNNFTAQNIDETEPGSKLVQLTNPEGTLPGSKGTWLNIKAPIGFFDQNTNILRLEQNVELFYSDGMDARTEIMSYDFNKKEGFGDKPVQAQGVVGNLMSEGFNFYTENSLLVFTGKTYINIREESLKGND